MAKERSRVLDASDKEQVNRAGRLDKMDRDQELADLREILKTKAGRRFIWRILEMSGIYKVTQGPVDLVNFEEGKRLIGVTLMGDIAESDDEALITMMREAKIRAELNSPPQKPEKERDADA